MKKLLLSLIALSFISTPAIALSGDKQTSVACGNDAASTSITAVAANATKQYNIYGVFVASDVADEITVKTGSTTHLGLHLGDTSGLMETFYPLFLSGADNEAITVTKAGATDLYYCVWYTSE